MTFRYKTWSRSRGARLPDGAYPCGHPIHITIHTVDRRRLFEALELAEAVAGLIARQESTLAYCLMPDHLHWLLRCARHDRRTVERLKSLTTRRSWTLGHSGRLWQRSYHDRVLRRADDVLAVARYLTANPLRAGLVDDIEEYPFQRVFLERMDGLR